MRLATSEEKAAVEQCVQMAKIIGTRWNYRHARFEPGQNWRVHQIIAAEHRYKTAPMLAGAAGRFSGTPVQIIRRHAAQCSAAPTGLMGSMPARRHPAAQKRRPNIMKATVAGEPARLVSLAGDPAQDLVGNANQVITVAAVRSSGSCRRCRHVRWPVYLPAAMGTKRCLMQNAEGYPTSKPRVSTPSSVAW